MEVLEETPASLYIVLPAVGAGLSDGELEAVSGGWGTLDSAVINNWK